MCDYVNQNRGELYILYMKASKHEQTINIFEKKHTGHTDYLCRTNRRINFQKLGYTANYGL